LCFGRIKAIRRSRCDALSRRFTASYDDHVMIRFATVESATAINAA
jgi:hypothetical protein